MTATTESFVPLPESATGTPSTRMTVDLLSIRMSRSSLLVVTVVLTAAIGIGDFLTGIELPFTILYMLPIAFGVWYRDRGFGLALSVLATLCTGASLVHDEMSPFAIIWNVVGAATLFAASSWGVARLRSYVDHEQALRRLAVNQLRHADRLNMIGTLAAGVAHELGTPLNVIAGCAELLAEESEEDNVRRRTRMILEQVTKVSTIIHRLLDFGHRGGVSRAHIDLGTVATSACDMLRSTAGKRGCSIVLDDVPTVNVNVNAAEIEQVLSNLIMNALQAMVRGTVRVRVGVAVRADHRLGSVEVEDEGCGIPADDLPRIFDPFFTTKGVGEGTGLGLSVSYGIVRDHDGTIEVTSEPKRGSRFTVLLPAEN